MLPSLFLNCHKVHNMIINTVLKRIEILLILVIHSLEIVAHLFELLGLSDETHFVVVNCPDDIGDRGLVLQSIVDQVPVVQNELEMVLDFHLLGD